MPFFNTQKGRPKRDISEVRRAEMGVWDAIYSIGDGVRGVTPDLSTVKRTGCAFYHYPSAVVTKVDQLVRENGIQKLPQYWPNDEARAQIGLFSTILAKNTAKYAVYEGFKHIPGASVASKLATQTMEEVNREKQKGGMKAMEQNFLNSTLQPEIHKQNANLSSRNAGGGQTEKIEDVIIVLMKTEFIGNHMFRDLMVPKITRVEKKDE